MENITYMECDVLVLGGGAAGIRAAIEAADLGSDVVMVSKKRQGRCGSTFYPKSLPWGILMSGGGQSDREEFLREILQTGCGCLDESLTEILVRDSNERFEDLCSYGIRFTLLEERKEKPCFGKKSRGAQLEDSENARRCLAGEIARRNIRVLEDIFIYDLIVQDGRCCGAVGICPDGGEIAIGAGAVIMAAGGAEALWKYSLATSDITGDGYAMALKYGARLTNLEFIQFIPGSTGPVKGINFHHPTLASLPAVLNGREEEFLPKYLPPGVTVEACLRERAGHGPFSSEDLSRFFDIGVCMESGYQGVKIVYPETYYQDPRYAQWRNYLSLNGVDTVKEPLYIVPHCQGFNGGILIDAGCRTGLENLYACGECAGGPHGANRMGGNAILATQVFGKIAGENAAKSARKGRRTLKPDPGLLRRIRNGYDTGVASTVTPEEVLGNIKQLMHENGMIIRKEENLRRAVDKIHNLRKSFNPAAFRQNRVHAVNAFHALSVSEAILHAMLYRRESRGAHYREDFPGKNEELGQMNHVWMDGSGNITSSFRLREDAPAENGAESRQM